MYAFIDKNTSDDLTLILKLKKSSFSIISIFLFALFTNASGQGSLNSSNMSFSNDPALTPILKAQSLFLAAVIISLIFFNYLPEPKKIILILFLLNFMIEFNFLRFTLKYFKKLNILFYIIGIFLINISIILGFLLGQERPVKTLFIKAELPKN